MERASSDLVYSSESDRPFEFFSLAYPGRNSAPSAQDFAKLIGRAEERAEELSLVEFFARHSATSDPYDSNAQKLRPRYDALMRVLTARLRDVSVYRVGKIEVDCFIVGLDTNGNLVGLRTVSIET